MTICGRSAGNTKLHGSFLYVHRFPSSLFPDSPALGRGTFRMLGIWGRSSLVRPPMSGVVRLATARHFHGSLRPLSSRPGVQRTLNASLEIHSFRAFGVRFNSTQAPAPKTTPPEKRSLLARFLPKPAASKGAPNTSSFRKILVLAKPEWKPLTLAIGLLLGSSAVSMSVPFTIGRLIDFFSTESPVSIVVYA